MPTDSPPVASPNAPGTTLRWYMVIGILFAIPPILAICGIHLPEQPADVWSIPQDSNAPQLVWDEEAAAEPGPASAPSAATDTAVNGDSDDTTATASAADHLRPCVLVLQSEQLLTKDTLSAIRDAVEKLREALPDTEVNWCGDVPSKSGVILRRRSVIPPERASDRRWERALEELKTHPLVAGHQLSEDGTTMLVLVSDSSVHATETARSVFEQAMEPVGVQLWLTGERLMYRDNRRGMDEWHWYVLGYAALTVALTGLLMLRAPLRSLAVGAGPGAALLMALGWERFLGLPANELSSGYVPVFVLVLAFAESLHILLAVEEEYGHVRDHRLATHLAMKRLLRPCFLTSLTTSLAFASLMISDLPMVSGFGRNASIAICVSFVGIVTAMPLAAADCVYRRKPKPGTTGRRQDRWIQKMILAGVRHPIPVVVVCAGLSVVFTLWSASRLYPDDRIDLRLNRNEPSYQGLLQADKKLGGLRQVRVSVAWTEEATDAQIWDVLTGIQQQIADSESFSQPLSILNALELVRRDTGPSRMRYANRLAQGQLSTLWDEQARTAALEFRVPDRGIRFIQPDLRQLQTLVDHEMEVRPAFRIEIGGDCLTQSAIVRHTIKEMSWSVGLASLMILLVIWVAYGRLSFALYAILPNAFAVMLTVAVRASMATSLDTASACAASICLGIAVDDTIHFLEAMRHAKGRPGSRIHILNAGHLVGRALVITTVTLFVGFSTVFVAPLPTHRFFASMVVAMLPAALAGDLIILPAVLSLFRRRPQPVAVVATDHAPAVQSDNRVLL